MRASFRLLPFTSDPVSRDMATSTYGIFASGMIFNAQGNPEPLGSGPLSLETLYQYIVQQSEPVGLPSTESFMGPGDWQVILPSPDRVVGARPDAIWDALQPLVAHRMQTHPGRVNPPLYLEIKGEPTAANLEAWWQLHSHALTGASILLAGDERDLPFAVHRWLNGLGTVGRLSFACPSAYHLYAKKVVRYERNQSETSGRILAFAPEILQDAATQLSRHHLISPLLEGIQDHRPRQRVTTLLSKEATRQKLMATLNDASLPPVKLWMVATHGLEDPGGTDPRIGALFDQNLSLVGASDFTETTSSVPGGVAVFFACNGAGRSGAMEPVPLPGFASRTATPQPDRVSNLTSALLLQPNGPLAVVGHLDLLYLTTLLDSEGQPSVNPRGAGVAPYRMLIEQLLRGQPLHTAMLTFRDRIHSRLSTLMRMLAARSRQRTPTQGETQHLVDTWLDWRNAESWVILGDPAVRLPPGPDIQL